MIGSLYSDVERVIGSLYSDVERVIGSLYSDVERVVAAVASGEKCVRGCNIISYIEKALLATT